jgi:YegS/Rv2252/BmrU family lipid kinase
LKDIAPVRVKRLAVDTVLIVNPNSCSGLTGKNWEELYVKIKKIFGTDIKVVFSKKQGDGTNLARGYLQKGFGKVIAIGGDGTINEVANGFFAERTGLHSHRLRAINSDAIMGVVPCGTRNVLAKSLGLPAGVAESCRNFVGGSPTKIDLIAVSATNPDTGSRTLPRVFLNAAEIGLGAEIIDRSKKMRSKLKSRLVSTMAAIISTVPSYESNLCDVFIDGRKKSTNMTMGVVANGKFLGGGFMVAPEASITDGLLDLVIMKDSGSFKMLDELLSIKDGNYEREDNILYAKAKKVVIKSNEREVTVTIDGEPVGILPATFYVLPKALTIVV